MRAIENTIRNDTGTATIHSSSRIHHGTSARRAGPAAVRDGSEAGAGVAGSAAGGGGATGTTRVVSGAAAAIGAGAVVAATCARATSGTFSVRPHPEHGNEVTSPTASSGCLVLQSGHCSTGAIELVLSRLGRFRVGTDADQCIERTRRAAAVDGRRRDFERGTEFGRGSGHDERGGGVHERDVAERSLLAREHRVDRARVGERVTAGELLGLGANDAEI